MNLSPGPILVGLTFLWTAGMKSLSPNAFYIHLQKLRVLPERFITFAVSFIAGVEAAIGVALVIGAWPEVVIPSTAVLLVVLSIITWLSVKSGRVSDCGCYGGFIVPSVQQSLLINSLLVALLLSSLVVGTKKVGGDQYVPAIVFVSGLAFGIFAWLSIRSLRTKGSPLVDLSPLKIGNKWRIRYAAGTPVPDSGELIVAYLGPDCPFCKQWIPVFNAMDKSATLPQVVGVSSASGEKLESFKKAAGIQFPVNAISQSLMNRLVLGVPTTVIVSKGRISDMWTGQMTGAFVNRFKEAFFPDPTVQNNS